MKAESVRATRWDGALLVISATVVVAALGVAAATVDQPTISVREHGGVYTVAARFAVTQPPDVVHHVLTDYGNIPRFMPDVRTSQVLEHHAGYARLEQEAVAKYMMFSKRVHLVLEVEEGADAIRFRDICNRSFTQYEGAWTVARGAVGTVVTYELTARPAFNVPSFVLRKLLDRDAHVMIERLRNEIRARDMPR